VDDFLAAKRAVELLLAAGRTRIALLNGPIRYKYAVQRRQGYLEALRNAGLKPCDKWMVQIPDIDFGIALSAAASQLGGSTPPDAYVASSDVLAAAVIRAAKQVGMRVPEDVMVVGFDNVDISRATSPTITTVSLPKFQLGYTACELLIDKINNPAIPPQQVLLGTEMIMRESTNAAPSFSA
jgi:LacI family repressor for deo operon, udp, cdd, tsx, nupC, and nupG